MKESEPAVLGGGRCLSSLRIARKSLVVFSSSLSWRALSSGRAVYAGICLFSTTVHLCLGLRIGWLDQPSQGEAGSSILTSEKENYGGSSPY